MSAYNSIGDRGRYQYQERLSSIALGVEETYKMIISKYGVTSVSLTFSEYNQEKSSVVISLKLKFADDKSTSKSWSQFVDEGALEAGSDFLSAYCSASPSEVKDLLNAIKAGEDLSTLEPDLWQFLAQEYALQALPNETEGGEWLSRDEEHLVDLFDLKRV